MTLRNPDRDLGWKGMLILFLVLLALGMLLTFCVVEPARLYAQTMGSNTLSLRITNFGNGMTPALPPFRNDQEGIVLSQNMYSLLSGGRQLRHGYVELVDSASAAANCGNTGVDAVTAYEPAVGARRLMYAIGGKWCYGNLDTTGAKLTTGILIPYLTAPPGDKLNWMGDSAWYSSDSLGGSRFLEHLQVGDTLSFGPTLPTSFQRRIRWIIDNKKVKFTSGGLTSDSGVYTVRRWYHNDSAIAPFYYQYQDNLFTGTKRDRAQVIYPTSTNNYAIRPMGIADSVHVDALYFKFGGDSISIVRSYDTASDGKEFFLIMQIVDRNKAWFPDSWGVNTDNASETFYFRFGTRAGDSIGAMTYRILGNTDTSLFVAAMFVDTATNRAFCDTLARYKADTIDFKNGFVGGRGYIFSSAGNFKTVHTGISSLLIDGGGALLLTDDSLHVDSLSGIGGIYFVRPLDEVTIPIRRFLGWRYRSEDVLCGQVVATPPGHVLLRINTWYDRAGKCITRYTFRYPVTGTQPFTPGRGFGFSPAPARYQAVTKFTYFPILDIQHRGTNMAIRSALSFDPGASRVTINRWEIVRVDLPMFAGMTEFRQQVYAWGDTSALGTINKSKPNVPGALGIHAWSGSDDILVGDNPSEAVVGAAGYDDQLFVGQKHGMLSTVDDILFTEIANGIGLSSRRGLVLHNKEARWPSDDGVYSVQRRDLIGYSVQKISTVMDPVFNKWGVTEYGANVVPFTVNRALLDQQIMVFNQRDQHNYLFFAEGSATYNNRCLTYDINRNIWDGYFTFGAGAATVTSFHDTTRLLFGSPTGPVIYAYDYKFSDAGTAITGVLQGAPFYFSDNGGWPISTKIQRIKLLARTTSASVDTVQLIMVGDVASDTFLISYNAASITDSSSIMYSNKDNSSVKWYYKIRVKGKATGSIYQPHSLDVDFIPVWRDQ